LTSSGEHLGGRLTTLCEECGILIETMRPLRSIPRIARTLFVLLLALPISGATPPALLAGETNAVIHWTEAEGAQVKLDGKVPIKWNLYEPDKKDKKKDPDQALVLLGRRYLLIDTKAKIIYEVKAADLRASGTGFESGDLTQNAHVVPSTEWTSRDVGPAQLIDLTLEDYGRTLEIQLPHPFIITPPVHYF
jgi:hypothetical protein